jgi:hypothetical protein
MTEHRWGPKFRCLNEGCNIARNAAHPQWWRRGWKHTAWLRVPIPPCTGTPPAARCTHVERAPVSLGPGHSVVGGIKVDQCERPALPRMVVCEHHATPDAVRIVMLEMAEEIERLKQLPSATCDNPYEPAAPRSTK